MWFTAIAFFAKISDPNIGGTNMTLLTTIAHLGESMSTTAALWLIDILTFKRCFANEPCSGDVIVRKYSIRNSQHFKNIIIVTD